MLARGERRFPENKGRREVLFLALTRSEDLSGDAVDEHRLPRPRHCALVVFVVRWFRVIINLPCVPARVSRADAAFLTNMFARAFTCASIRFAPKKLFEEQHEILGAQTRKRDRR